MYELEAAQNWNFALDIALLCLVVMALMAYDLSGLKETKAEDKDIVVGCLCRTRHKPGDCPRDREWPEE